MKRIVPVFALIMSFCAVGLADDLAWKTYTSEGGGYSILLPKEPTEQSQEVNTALGPIKVKIAIVQLDANTGYVISVNDYPDSVGKAPPENVLNGVVKGAVADGTLVSSDKTTYKGTKIPGRDVIFITKQGVHGRMRVYLAGVRLYQVMALAKEDTTKAKATEKYFESFEIKAATK